MFDLVRFKLYPYIAPHKKRALGAILLSFALAAIGGAQVSLVKPLFDKGLSASSTREDAIILALQLLGLGLLNFPCRFFHFYWLRYIMDRATCSVREEIFSKLMRLPASFFGKSKQGDLISHILNDTNIFAQGFKATIDLIREPLKAVVYLSMAFWADWQLTIIIFVLAPFLIAIFGVSGKKVKNNQGDVQREQGQLTHSIAEGISAHKITKAFNLQDYVFSRFTKTQDKFFTSQMRTTFVEEMAHPFVEVIGALAFAGVIVFAHYRIQTGETTIGEFISFIAALALFMDPIRKFSQANVKLSQARAASERIHLLLDTPQEIDEGTITKADFTTGISVEGLRFSYGEGEVIKGLNLKVNKGEKIALVGLSGSGKSTLINLLLGLYPFSEGKILIDGKALQDYTLHGLRDFFGLVSQDIFLFNDTIHNNLCLGKDFSESQIKEALSVAYCDEFINKLPDGLETIVGDRGTRLSGGQQQRITIARAYLQESPILLFDEATSALDNESEKVVQKALENLAGHKTVIAVAHRLSTIQDYDRIYVLHEGTLVEEGTHAELCTLGGEYSKLYELSK
ncbi:MAG: ABC transporter ATP-binding protein/permease [Bacteriovoracaceae bacterium]|nr:ABC transporter ATP-binding protein/permease [Bacteriovoracaceae bacterium]